MHKAAGIVRRTVLFLGALILVVGHPAVAMATAQESATGTELTESAQSSEGSEKKELTYTYDPVTKKWNSEEWQWNPATNTYEQPSAPIIVEPNTQPLLDEVSSEAVEDTKNTENASTNKDIDTEVNITHTVESDATSGDALITHNTEAGNALSGDAEAVATIINSVNSNITADKNQKIATFTKDIMGDVKGDIILYPMLLKAMLEQKANQSNSGALINSSSNLNLNNDINLNAKSGNATVDQNTSAGDATSGNAAAMANVVNILNSLIATQDSFIGTINIYGSLEGDILIAPDFIPQMLASNGSSDGPSTQLSTQDTTTIVNNISAVAESGAASVFGNTKAGSANSGDAESNVVIFNVTGRNIIAENSMLVFVNVLGKWVGMIVDAPAGATAAIIGNGVKDNQSLSPDLTVQAETKHGITNNISVTATSGDATVSNNTSAGNATSGDAYAFANVANLSNSSLSLSGWFGILFINITGDWFGSFQIDTPFGNKTPEAKAPKPSGPIQFIPKEDTVAESTPAQVAIIDSRDFAPTTLAGSDVLESDEPEDIEDETTDENTVMGVSDDTTATKEKETINYALWIVFGLVALGGGAWFGMRRFS